MLPLSKPETSGLWPVHISDEGPLERMMSTGAGDGAAEAKVPWRGVGRWPVHVWTGRLIVPVILAAAVLWQSSLFRAACSAVFDEWAYLQMALRVFHEGRVGSPAGLGVGPLPVLLSYWLPVLALPGDLRTIPLYARAIDLARLAHVLLVGVPLVLVPYAWMARRRGYAAAALVGTLLAFSPVVLAATSTAVTDACFALCALLAIGALDAYLRRPCTGRLLLLGAALGAALAAKYSSLFLVPVFFIALVASALATVSKPRTFSTIARAARSGGVTTAILLVEALLIVWALHGFACMPLVPRGWPGSVSDWSQTGKELVHLARTLPLPAPLHGIFYQWDHMRLGQTGFLMGRLSLHGFWYYFPCVFLLKSTPAELLLAVLLPFLLWRQRARRDQTQWLWILSLLLLMLASACSTLNLGIRYVLLLYPLLALSAVDLLAGVRPRKGVRAAAVAMAALAVLQVTSAALTAPRYLGYMNRLFTRPGEGYKYVADSNIDWGQDLPALRDAMKRRGASRVLFAYFGSSAPLEAYGVTAVLWESSDWAAAEQCRWFALSSSYLSGLDWPAFSELRRIPPDEIAGDSIFLYSTGRPDVRWALMRARSSTTSASWPLDERSLPIPLRRRATRLVFECLGAWFIVACLAFVLKGPGAPRTKPDLV